MANYIPTLERRVGRYCLVSFDLVGSLDPALPDEGHMLDRIYETLMRYDGSMRTFRKRFAQIDEEIRQIVLDFAPSTAIRIHDLAASNAVTSAELFEKLSDTQRDVHITASDLCTQIDVFRVSSGWRVINYADEQCCADRKWIQAVGKKLVVIKGLPLKKLGHSRTRFMFNWILACYVDLRVRKGSWKKELSGAGKKTLSLFHPDALDLASREDRFRLLQHDLLEPLPEKCHIVRAMTVLGRFRGKHFERALLSITHSIADGGYLVAGFGKKECSIFRKNGGRLQHFKDVGAPYGLKQQIEQVSQRLGGSEMALPAGCG